MEAAEAEMAVGVELEMEAKAVVMISWFYWWAPARWCPFWRAFITSLAAQRIRCLRRGTTRSKMERRSSNSRISLYFSAQIEMATLEARDGLCVSYRTISCCLFVLLT